MRKFLTTLLFSTLILCALSNTPYTIKVNQQSENTTRANFKQGTAVNPSGGSVYINSQNVVIDGKSVLPVMGEFHYARFPETDWRKELLKMKAGGITIVASYIFWIHHEEINGKYNWTGERNLRKFVETCAEVGLPIILRTGPWCHGEARNGGIPDWAVASGVKLRNTNPEYMAMIKKWFTEIFRQVDGLMWKDGGPVIGLQLDNEFRGAGSHLVLLKNTAKEIGFDVPLYTRTGWPALTSSIPFGEIIPLYGDYADGFWDRSLGDLPGNYWKSFIFRSFRNSTVIATEQLPPQSDKDNPDDVGYPFFTCELGGGMMTSYHRRIFMEPEDIYAMALVKVGSGSNLPGYYMYHGGTNPEGELTTLNEMQSAPMTFHNDLPIKTYDFQAPLGEFGQVNPHYHMLRRLHMFLQDFGSELTAMPPYFPQDQESAYKADSSLRWSVRSDGKSGYVFVSNYQRLTDISAKKDVKFTVSLPGEKLVFPDKPLIIPSGASFFMPFNMDMGGIRMTYSTAQPLAKIENVYVFAANSGIAPEFVFESNGVKIESSNVKSITKNDRIYFSDVKTGTGAAIKISDTNNQQITIVLLDSESALSLWKGTLSQKEYLFLSNSNLTYLGDELELTGDAGEQFSVSIFPNPESISFNSRTLKGKRDGVFTAYSVSSSSTPAIKVELVKLKSEDRNLREISKGKGGVSEMPSDADFDKAAVWEVVLPEGVDPSRDIYLNFPYVGDVARIYLDGKLLTDNFFNGRQFALGLKRYAAEIYKKELTIKVLPLKKDTPIYMPKKAGIDFGSSEYLIGLPRVNVDEKTTITLNVK